MGRLECIDLVEQVTEYLEGSLDAQVREQLAEHVAVCWGCERYVVEMTVMVQLMSQLPRERPSREFESSLLGMYRRQLRTSPSD
jgi:hypothetical protein